MDNRRTTVFHWSRERRVSFADELSVTHDEKESVMPLYEYVLREPGRPDEHLISDRNNVALGDEVTIRNRRWLVDDVTESDTPNAAKRNVLVPKPA
jgi:hypothetical protein